MCAYLVPKLFALNGLVPDYINPDGTKSILGDVVYYKNNKHHFGIEIKLESISLTKREFNEWIAAPKQSDWPNLFIGVNKKGLLLSTWATFRSAYINSVRSKNPMWEATPIDERYGPAKKVEQLALHMPAESVFPVGANSAQAIAMEEKFTFELRHRIEA